MLKNSEPMKRGGTTGLGLKDGDSHFAIWIEPHGATTGKEVDKVLEKLKWLKEKLRFDGWSVLRHLTDASRTRHVQQFWWLVPGTVCFRRGSNQEKKLARCGLQMPKKKIVIR